MSLTTTTWAQTFAYYRNHAYDPAVRSMAAMLEDIAQHIDNPLLDQIFDAYALTILEGPS